MGAIMAKILHAVKNDLFEVDVKDVRSSIDVMDMFEGNRSPNIKYKQMLLKGAIWIQLNSQKYFISLYISRERPENYPPRNSQKIPNTTFTELKKCAKRITILQDTTPDQFAEYSIFYPIFKTIKYYSRQHSIATNKVMVVQGPLLFCAQNSDNLRGYGDEWRFGECISVGTRYGETTDYYVTKIFVESV